MSPDAAGAGAGAAQARQGRSGAPAPRTSLPKPARPLRAGRPRGRQSNQRRGKRPVLKRLCASVLVFEAIVIVLAMPVAITIGHIDHGAALGVGGGLALAAVVLAGVVGRARWALVAGTVLQVLIIAAGVEVPALYVLGVIFAAFWFTGIWMAGKLERTEPR
jgi:hypothetical protein